MKMAKPMFAPHTSTIERIWYFTLRGLAVLTLLYLILPVLAIVPLSFSSSTFLVYPIPGWSMRWYQNLIASDEWRMAAKNSFIVAPSATVLATVLGTLAAIGLTKANFKGKALLMAILISPMIVPVVVVGVGMYLFFAPLGLANTYIGLIMAHASLGVPFVVTTVAATLQGFNYNLVRASLSLGASPVKTFFSITLPVIAPGVISGALFAFATSFDEVVVTLFLAGADQTTLPRQMFTGIRENISPTIAALATILIVFSTCLLLALEWLRGRNAARAVAA
ncbi:ABC transporter permease [Paraburkholderia sabiae]|jgi:putative spermidine/putrescine transport system permease protein|uniref:ABC transporter permease n=1 Tax=Paraburkholderia sabiae TaxID=273251 RepID=A0ABU9QKM4_9BURK|nr:ABC transporter permease [Paraburkholderia sabiae]WJZ71953.1 ABC transporter permease [Paraburkholderia sabiae]CAD6517593.1 Inner membrane ABC transporter permease protein YdcV [Paraburkholderia sabiae]